MGGFEADGPALAAASHDVRRAARRLHDERAQLDALVTGFLGHDWTGPAAESFVDAWQRWRGGAQDVADGLAAMGALLAVTRVDYEHADDDSSAAVRRVGGLLAERLG
jgi:WXG100 family type VII secretion target